MRYLRAVAVALTSVGFAHGAATDPTTDDALDTDSSYLTRYKHFVAHNTTQTCTTDDHFRPFNNQIRGVNMGGWLVLEPWITPSLFYQFLGGDETNTAFDMSTFCTVLGPEEGNKQLRRHWDAWVTEDIIKELADSEAVNSLRLPVGDFMYKPYGDYIGCTDGALEYVDKLLDWAHSYGLTVLIDVHTMKGSQNGFDNSGKTEGFQWTSVLNTYPAGLVTFEHWPIRTAGWMGEFDITSISYKKINRENIDHGLAVIQEIVNLYGDHPAVLGLEPINEPWQYTPIHELQNFYWDGYLIVKKAAPFWKYIMHDSFRFDVAVWGGFMAGCPDRALDTHIYQAWMDPNSRLTYYDNACSQKSAIAAMEIAFGPVVVGEWSLATDNCAMWLNGFNDNLPGFPRLPCKYIPCADPYMGPDQPGTPVDPSKAIQGPYGTGMSGPIFGQCPADRDWIRESSGNPATGRDWVRAPPKAPKHLDDTDNVMRNLAAKKINAFSNVGHGYYFWNFRTDNYQPQWSYMAALERGWIPKGSLNDPRITNACHNEDLGEFRCVVKHGQLESSIKGGLKYCLETEGKDSGYIETLSGSELVDTGSEIFNEFWAAHRAIGATCDFGGVAQLVELNRTITDDDKSYSYDDDEYFIVYRGPNYWIIGLAIFIALVVGSMVGFVVAMRVSKKFNKRVRESTFFAPLTKSKNPRVRSSLFLDQMADDYVGLNDAFAEAERKESYGSTN